MLTKEQIMQLREHLEKSQNPLFFFDNDVDGLCAFIILKRALGRGKGVAIKSFPYLSEMYLRKIDELNPDYIFVLDHSMISEKFIEGVEEKNLPLIILDHHQVEHNQKTLDKSEIFNSYPSSEPTTYLAYNIFPKKEEKWLAMIGSIGDVYKPDFSKEFGKENSELFDDSLDAFDCLYKTEIGKISRMLNCGLKDTTTNVLTLIKFLEKAQSPSEILSENSHTRALHLKFQKLNKYVEKVSKKVKLYQDKILVLEYSGQDSISSEISNYLLVNNRNKAIIVAFRKPECYNVSLRGKNIKKVLLKSIEKMEGATGGGHDDACGARIPSEHWDEFKKNMIELVEKA